MNHNYAPSQKRNLLWNMIEPGDPYDIKKSLIARVPGDKRIFMGDHLELVCLFQAAEIERLHDSLRQYGVRFKELQRVDLDRHSYQTQIKQLMEMSDQGRNFKQQIIKLKEFIRKQTLEMEDIKKKSANLDEELEYKYQQALRKLQTFFNQNNHLKFDVQNLQNKIHALKITHEKQLEQLRGILQSDRRIQLERQINEITNGFKNQRNHLELEIRRLKERIQSEEQTNQQLRDNIQQLNRTIAEYQLKLQQSIHVQSSLTKYQQKLRNLSYEFERIQQLLNEKSADNNKAKFNLEKKQLENQQLNLRITDLEQDVTHLNNQKREQQRRLDEFIEKQGKLLEYQQKLVMLTQQVQRLRHVNNNKQAQIIEYSNKISQFQSQISNIRKQYRDLQSLLRESQFQKQRLKGQINSSSQHSHHQTRQLEQRILSLQRQNEQIRDQHQNYARECDTKLRDLIVQITRLNEIIKTKIAELKQRDSELREYQNEIINLRRLNSQIEELERQNSNFRLQISQFKGQREKLNAQMRATASELQSENQQLKRRIRQNENMMTKTAELERTIYGLRENIQSINNGLRAKNDENTKLRLQISDVRHLNSRLSEEIQGNKRQLTSSVNISNENTDLRNKIFQLSQQIQRLNGNLGSKIDELKQAKQLIQRSKISVEDYSSKQQSFKRVQIQLKQTISLYEQQISSLNLDIEKNRKRIQQLQNQIGAYKREGQDREYEYNRQRENYIKQLRNKEKQIFDLQQKYNIEMIQNNQKILKDSNHKITSLQNQIHTLTDNLSRKSNEIIRIQADNREKDLLVNKLKNEISNLNIKIAELNRIKAAYEDSMASIADLTQENRQIKDRISGQEPTIQKLESYEERIVVLSVQVQRLYKLLKQRDDDILKLKRNDSQSAQQLRRTAFQHQEQLRLLETRIRGQYDQSLRRAENLEQELRNYISNSKILLSQMSQKDNQVARWKKLYEEIESKLTDEVRYGSQFGDKVQVMSHEIDRLNVVLSRKLEEYNQLRDQYHLLQESQNIKQEDQMNKIQQYILQIQRLNSELLNKVNQVNSLSISYNNLEQQYQLLRNSTLTDQKKNQILEYQIMRLNETIALLNDKSNNQSTNLINEIQRLNNALRLKVIQSQEWQDQVNRSGQQLNKQYNQLQINYQKALKDCQGYRFALSQYQQKIIGLNQQFQKLNKIIQKLKHQNQLLRLQNYNFKEQTNQDSTYAEMNKKLCEEIDRLNKIKSQLQEEISELRIRYADEAALQKRLNEHLSLFVVLFAEVESLRVRVKDKEKEVEEVRRTSLAPFKIS